MEGNPKIPSNEYLTVRATTGFQRVRYFGWLSAAAKNKWERILALLDYKQPPLTAPTALPPPLNRSALVVIPLARVLSCRCMQYRLASLDP